MTKDEINAFIHPFKPDIRQSTLQLQYVLSTGEIDQVIFIKSKYKIFKSLYLFLDGFVQNIYSESFKSKMPNKFKFYLVELASFIWLSFGQHQRLQRTKVPC